MCGRAGRKLERPPPDKVREGRATVTLESSEDAKETALVRELRARIADLKTEVDFLRARVEELTPLAPPRPRHVFLGWFRRRGS